MKNNLLQIVFLEYLSRSGSTVLAQHLDQLPGVYCTLEVDLPRQLFMQSKGNPGCLSSYDKSNLDDLMDVLWRDPKIQSWPLTKATLRKELETQGSLRIGVFEIIYGIARCLVEANPDTTVVIFKGIFKHPEYLRYLNSSPYDCKLLGIIRDPRAIFSSQLLARRQDSNFPIGITRKSFIRDWRMYVQAFTPPTSKRNVHICQYENLVRNEDMIIGEIAAWINIPYRLNTESSDYHQRIPKEQAHLHQNVGLSLKEEPLISWKSKLPVPAWNMIQKDLGGTMKQWDYSTIPPPKTSLWSNATYVTKEFWTSLKFRFFRAMKLQLFKG